MDPQPKRPSYDRTPPAEQPLFREPVTSPTDMAAFEWGPSRPGHQAHDALALALQPRHALCTGALRAAEASLHGSSPDVRYGDPDTAQQIGSWLLEKACHEAQDWNAMLELPHILPSGALRFSPEVTLSVDLPTAILRRDRLVTQTKQALARSGLLPCLLELQLPGQALADGDTGLLLSLAALRDLGVGLGLDHFGSVAASPRVLQRLPLTAVKLDPILTRDIVKDRAIRVSVKAAIALAHALGATVLATGVENATQRDILADLGCDDAQGPMFGGKLRPEAFHNALLVPRVW